MEKRDYIVDQIEKIAKIIAALGFGKTNMQPEVESFEEELSRLSGIPKDLFLHYSPQTLERFRYELIS